MFESMAKLNQAEAIGTRSRPPLIERLLLGPRRIQSAWLFLDDDHDGALATNFVVSFHAHLLFRSNGASDLFLLHAHACTLMIVSRHIYRT